MSTEVRFRFLIDVNLPYRFSLWDKPEYIHQKDIDDEWSDEQIWEYAQESGLTIITKDTDFYNKIILAEPPPRVIHIKLGNMKLRALYTALNEVWPKVISLSEENKLVSVFPDKIEAID